jgi:hypothetical protein
MRAEIAKVEEEAILQEEPNQLIRRREEHFLGGCHSLEDRAFLCETHLI